MEDEVFKKGWRVKEARKGGRGNSSRVCEGGGGKAEKKTHREYEHANRGQRR